MAQIDRITYSGQLVTTLVGFTTLLWFVGTVVRSNTHRFVGLWNQVPALTSRVTKSYVEQVSSRAVLFSNTFGTLVSRMVDTLSAYAQVAAKSLATYVYVGTWKSSVADYAVKTAGLVRSISNK